jgi:hypothetical protein
VFGIDLSPRMLAVARQSYPELRFNLGSMLDLDLPDGTLGGLVAWYSIIHIPDERLGPQAGRFTWPVTRRCRAASRGNQLVDSLKRCFPPGI